MPDDRMSTGEVARLFRVRRFTVVRWAERGLLVGERTRQGNGWWRFDAAVVAAFVRPGRKRLTRRECGLPGCGRTHHAEDMCRPHYQRWMRTGDARPDVPIEPRWFGQYNRRPRAARAAHAPRRFDLIDDDEL